jgi:hypothetical protein
VLLFASPSFTVTGTDNVPEKSGEGVTVVPETE